MSKAVQAFLSGVFFTFILDFFLLLGVEQNYIKKHNIDLYYNILFADNQNIFIFLFFSIVIGYTVIYLSNKTALIFLGVLFLLVGSSLIPPIGNYVGELLLMKKNTTLQTNKFTYHGDIYYKGRKTVTFYDYDLKKVIILQKNKIKGEI